MTFKSQNQGDENPKTELTKEMATDDVHTLIETADKGRLWPIRKGTGEGHLEKSFQGRKYRI